MIDILWFYMLILGIVLFLFGLKLLRVSWAIRNLPKLPTASKDCWQAQEEIRRMKSLHKSVIRSLWDG